MSLPTHHGPQESAESPELGKAPAPQASPLSWATSVMTAQMQMHIKAPEWAGRFLVTLNATKKPWFLATQIHLPWTLRFKCAHQSLVLIP